MLRVFAASTRFSDSAAYNAALNRTLKRAPKRSIEPSGLALFALLFTFVFLLHLPLLRLPYFWDEAGYYIPAARDILLGGDFIPHSTPTNAHPPLVMAWLALWWKLSGYAVAVTRTAMLVVSAFALLGVYRLARKVANTQVALASVLLTALFPVWFAQSTLAHLDMAAAAFTIWGVLAYVQGQRWHAIAWFGLAGISKETAIAAPMALFAWEAAAQIIGTRFSAFTLPFRKPSWSATLGLLLALVPLGLWFTYHWAKTGMIFGNPEFIRYNVTATLNPLRIILAGIQRLWQSLGYMNLFVLTGTAALAMFYPSLPGRERDRISIPVQLVFAVVLLAYVGMLAVLGGAVIARYMLPVIPLVIIVSVSTIRRRVSFWPWIVVITAAGFGAALFSNPYYRSSPEDSLNYASFIRLHKQGAEILAKRYPESRILTAWPASDELTKPYLGYVRESMKVVRLENFAYEQIALAAQAQQEYDVAFVFSTKLEPRYPLLGGWAGWRRIQERFFDYHRDLPPELIASMLQGRIVHSASANGQWVAIIEFPRIRNAELRVERNRSIATAN